MFINHLKNRIIAEEYSLIKFNYTSKKKKKKYWGLKENYKQQFLINSVCCWPQTYIMCVNHSKYFEGILMWYYFFAPCWGSSVQYVIV